MFYELISVIGIFCRNLLRKTWLKNENKILTDFFMLIDKKRIKKNLKHDF